VLISKPYQRYLLNRFRDDLEFSEVPIKLYLRRRHPADVRDDIAATEDTAARKRNGQAVDQVTANAKPA
jgi:hypothetical protein